MATTTQFGSIQAIVSKTPMWAKIAFGVATIIITVASFIIASDPAINDALKVRLMMYLKGIDLALLGFTKLFGVVHDDDVDNTGRGSLVTPITILAIVLSVLLLGSCTTAKKCAEKFPPQIITVDTTIIKDTVIYRDTVITVPGKTVTIIKHVKDTTEQFDTTLTNGKISIRIQQSKGRLSAICNTDSLQLVINFLQAQIKSIQRYRSEVKHVPYPVVEYKTPKWCYRLLWANIIVIVLLVLWLLYRAKINSFFLKK